MRFDILSLFPEFVAQQANHGVVGRAGERGLLQGDRALERFAYVCTELSVASFLTIAAQPLAVSPEGAGPGQAQELEAARLRLAYTAVDAYCVLVCALVQVSDARAKPSVLAHALEAVARVMAHEVAARAHQVADPEVLIAEITRKAQEAAELDAAFSKQILETIPKMGGDPERLAVLNNRVNARIAAIQEQRQAAQKDEVQ